MANPQRVDKERASRLLAKTADATVKTGLPRAVAKMILSKAAAKKTVFSSPATDEDTTSTIFPPYVLPAPVPVNEPGQQEV